jgi:osmotically-inducible protein OsmY
MYGLKRPQLLCVALVLSIGASACRRPAPTDAKQDAHAAATAAKTRAAQAWGRFSDAWITTIVKSKLVGDREIRARDVDVSTRDGVVTLKGHVLNEPLRQLAVVLAKDTNGVKGVDDQLDVQVAPPVARRTPPPASAATGAVGTTGSASGPVVSPESDDARITSAIQSKYFLDDRIKQRHVDVSSSGGVVTLTGEVADDSERAQALLLARTTNGVTRVEDHLTIAAPAAEGAAGSSSAGSAPAVAAAPPVAVPPANADDALATRVKSQLSTDASANGGAVEVTAKNGVVLLQGTVPTPAVKQRMLTAARAVEGVTQVVDRIRVGTAKR